MFSRYRVQNDPSAPSILQQPAFGHEPEEDDDCHLPFPLPLSRQFTFCGHKDHDSSRPCNSDCIASGLVLSPAVEVVSPRFQRCSDCRANCPPLSGQSHCCSPGCSCPPDCVCTSRSVNPNGCVSHTPRTLHHPPLSFGG